MTNDPVTSLHSSEFEISHFVHTLLKLVLSIRYRKNLVIAVMVASVFLGGLYHTTAPRKYSAKAALLVSQNGHDQLDTSIASNDSLSQNTMPTFENIIRSAAVLESAMQKLGQTDRVDFLSQPRETWVQSLKDNVSAKTIRSTNIIEVGYISKDPQVAANVVSAVVQSYLDFMDKIHKGTACELSRILTQERDNVAVNLNQKQEELLSVRRNLADLGLNSESKTLHPVVQRAVYFNDSLLAAQKERIEYEAALAALIEAIRNGQDIGQYINIISDVIGKEILLNSLGLSSQDAYAIANMSQSTLSDRADLETMKQNLGPRHPDVIALSEKIRLTEQFIEAYKRRLTNQESNRQYNQLGPWLAQILQQKVIETKTKENILLAKFEETRAEAVDLSGQLAQVELLERDIKRLGDMNDVLLNQIASLDLKQNGQDVRVAVIEEPKVTTSPVSPRLTYTIILTLVGGFITSLSLVTVFDALDDRFRSLEELQNRLGLTALTVIQRLKTPDTTGLHSLATFTTPTAPECEGFRTLRTALTLTHQDVHQILITSLESGDGKTTTLANLAVCYAQADKRTLLIDADLRRSGLTNLLDARGTTGLSEILRLDGNVEQLAAEHIHATGIKGLDILPAGPRPSNPAELLAGPRFSQLLSWAGSVYDMILIDTTPALLTADPAIISRVVDGVMMVVKPAKNRRRQVIRMVERYAMLKLPMLGMIVNAAGSENDDAYYSYHGYYSYGYGNYESNETETETDNEYATVKEPKAELRQGVPIISRAVPRFERTEEKRPLNIPKRVA